jgi:putative transposase
MPRGPRLDAPGILHHVRARGVGRGAIFLTETDREDFLERLETAVADDAAFVYAWSLMPNHFHLAVRTGNATISKTMKRLLAGYATAFNKRHKRDGHLFQNRFKSTVVDEERYFLALVRYIHLNPVAAKMVPDVDALKTYAWTGHSVLMGKQKRVWQDVDEVLGRFGRKVGHARRELVAFMMSGEGKKFEKLFKGGGLIRSMGGISELEKGGKKERTAYDERILGKGGFVEAVLKTAESQLVLIGGSESERKQKFEALLVYVSKRSGFSKAELTGRDRRRELVKYRRVFVYLAVTRLGLSATSVGRMVNLSPPNAVRALAIGEEVMRELRWRVKF